MKYANVLVSLCLVLAVSAVIAYVYIVPKGSEGSNNLIERVNKIESRLGEQLVLGGGELDMNTQTFSFWIMHIGTANVTISEIRVNNVLNSSGSGWEGSETLAPGQVGKITLYGLKYFAEGFTSDNCHPIMVITTNGNTFYFDDFLTFTVMKTEQLEIQGCTFNTGNANVTFSVQNTGTAVLTIVEVRVNDEYATMNPSSVTLDPGDQTTITVTKTEGFISGVKYEFKFITAKGNIFLYTATAP
jgi:archaellum component FlaF (FlaF/FlaG flagellin family)